MSELGIVVQGVASSSPDGVRAAVWLLANRSLAILLATSALAALGDTLGAGRPGKPATRWKGWLALFAFVVSILALAGVPPLGGFALRKQIYAALQPQGSYMLIAWLAAALGIVLGLVRVCWSLWHAPPHPTESRLHYVGLLLVVCLLLLYLWVGLHPQPSWNPLADLVRGI
jgi:formate hydrogenlyase subunit 3/multisubunit Na+/H+ antiporter MnhD subunit